MDNFSLSGGPSIVNTGSQTPSTTDDPATQEKYTILDGATIIHKLLLGTTPAYPTDLGTSYRFPEAMGTDGQILKLNASGKKLEWKPSDPGGQAGSVVVGSTDDDLSFIASGNITVGNNTTDHIVLQGGIKNLHAEDNSAGPTIDITTRQYSVSFTNPNVTTVRLPPADSVIGHTFIIIKGHGGPTITVTIALASGDAIDGISSIPLISQDQRIKVMSIGDNKWLIIV